MKKTIQQHARDVRPLALALGQYVAKQCPDSEFETRLERAARLLGRLPSDAAFLYSRGLLGDGGTPWTESAHG